MPARSGISSASMNTASSFSSSWLGSSPSSKSPARNAVKSPSRNSIKSPARNVARRTTLDKGSPSRQMVLEFSQMLIRSDEDFTNRLDRASAENAQQHQELLSKAALEHERVREGAELERKRLILEKELQQRQREEEQRQEFERVKREKEKQEAEARQREIEAKKREEEAAQRAAEHQRQLLEAEDRIKAQKSQEEAARKQKEQQDEADRKAREEAAAAASARAQVPKQPPQAQQAPQASLASAPSAMVPQAASAQEAGASDVEKIHSRYLELHQRMKAFWKPFKQQCAQRDNPLKGPVGDLRREIRKAIGQVTTKREVSKVVITKLREIFRQARNAGGPTVDIRPFIASRPLPAANDSEAQYPAILLYAFICFEKFVIKQFDNEAAEEEGGIIQELGQITGSLFVDKEFMWNGVPLIDLLLAKYHRACPILFGINGSMNTAEGRARLGFSGNNVNYYHQRMLGLGAGYAALTLRAVATPAIPISEYWRAVSTICNIPSQNLYSGHFMVTKGLVRDSAKKFLNFYGSQGKAVLRRATINFPDRAPPRASEAASLVRVLPDVLKTKGVEL